MAEVTLSNAVRSNLLSLQNTAQLLEKTQNRLSTGLKVNSALDDPTAFFTASSLNSRAGDLSRLLDSASNGIQTIQAANNGLTAITKTVESLQANVNQARQDASFKSTSFSVDSTTIGTATAKTLDLSGGSVGSTAVSIALNSTGSVATQSTVTASADYVAPTAATQATVAASADFVAPTAEIPATQSVVTAANDFTDIDLTDDASDALTFDIDLGGTTKSITLDRAGVGTGAGGDNVYDIDEAVAEIQAQLNAGPALGVTVGKSGNKLTFTATAAGATALTVDNVAVVDGGAGGGVVAADTNLGVSNPGAGGQTDTGDALVAAVDRAITISDGTNTSTITLTSANASDAATARATITAALATDSVNLTVGGAGDHIDLTGAADGSNSITIGGADADDVFGAARVNTAGVAAVNREVTVSNGTTTSTITLTSANGADAATARATITAQLATDSVTGVTVGGAGDRIDLTGAADGSNTVTVGGADATSVFGAAHTDVAGVESTGGSVQTVDQLVTAINGNSSLTDKVRASNDNGKLRIENLSLESLTVTGTGTDGVDGSAGTSEIGGNTVRRDLANQFNLLRTELNKLADDSGFNGINLLRGDKLKLNFNEGGTSNIEIQAKDSTGAVRAINTTNLDIGASTNEEFGSNTSLDSRREGLGEALSTLRTQASQFGSSLSIVQNRQDFTKKTINTLETGAANLTLADTNLEGANLLALQTRQQLSSTALSLASQADQNVLRLF